jgi:murein DD-endopeptidase MepM/ murein hydrolase activator NlpD
VNGDLRSLLAAATAKRHAQEAAAERALAAAALASSSQPLPQSAAAPPTVPAPTFGPSTAPPAGPPAPPPPPSSSGGYANPLRAITALVPERIDQGVDYAGFGSLYAIGNGVVLNTVASGWPGGTFIAYQLSDGPAAGLVVFAAEDIQPGVQVGDRVTSNTVIGHMYAGPYGIEMGWADGSRLPDTMARRYGQYDGSNPTAFGYNFSRLLQSVGAPGGILNGAPNGDLPASWPRW